MKKQSNVRHIGATNKQLTAQWVLEPVQAIFIGFPGSYMPFITGTNNSNFLV
jgi:hypothetical protein